MVLVKNALRILFPIKKIHQIASLVQKEVYVKEVVKFKFLQDFGD